MTGIYLIQNQKGKIYIGQSCDIEERWKSYKKLDCKSQPRLYNSLKKYGVENHSFHIAFECPIENLNYEERFYQDVFDVLGKEGLNCMLTKSNDRSGHHSEETKQKISEAKKNPSEETRLKLSDAKKGKKLSSEHKKKLSEIAKGNKNLLGYQHLEEAKRKIAEAQKGKIVSVETRKKLSIANKGKKFPEGKTAYNKGKKMSDETRKKISESCKKRHLRKLNIAE